MAKARTARQKAASRANLAKARAARRARFGNSLNARIATRKGRGKRGSFLHSLAGHNVDAKIAKVKKRSSR